jgi:hypothetical protein
MASSMMHADSLDIVAYELSRRKNPPFTGFSLSDSARVDWKGLDLFNQILSERRADDDKGNSSPLSEITSIILPAKALDDLSQLESGWVGFNRAISKFNSLEHLEISSGRSFTHIFRHELEDLLLTIAGFPQLKSLKVLSLIIFGARERNNFASVLQQVRSIEELILPQLLIWSGQNTTLLLSTVCGPSYRLRTLHLAQSRNSRRSPISDEAIQVVFRSGTLQNVTLRNMNLGTSQFRIMAEELSRSFAMERIDVRGESCDSTEGYYYLLSKMQTQYYVKDFKLCYPFELEFSDELPSTELREKKRELAAMIGSFAALNAARRRHIMRDDRSTREDWVSLMSVVQLDVNALFNLLVSNPKVCDRIGLGK